MFFLPQNFYQYFFLFSLYEVSSLKKKKKKILRDFHSIVVQLIQFIPCEIQQKAWMEKKKMKYVGACKRCICTAKSVYNVSSSE